MLFVFGTAFAGNNNNDISKLSSDRIEIEYYNNVMVITVSPSTTIYPIMGIRNKRHGYLELYPSREVDLYSDSYKVRYVLDEDEKEFLTRGNIIEITLSNMEQLYIVPIKSDVNQILRSIIKR